jgi:8-amino-7-oxononanoate synthase
VESDKLLWIDQKLAERKQTHQYRVIHAFDPRGVISGIRQRQTSASHSLINFSSNDYLGLSKHPLLIAKAQEYAQRYGIGSTASRLVTGTYPIHEELEKKLAVLCQREAALLFNSGFQANATILPALLDRRSLVIADRFIHNSLIQGILASRAHFVRYRHNDWDHLEKILKKASQKEYSAIVIASETVFSMDGDCSDIDQLVTLSKDYNTILYLDDAHAFGVFGWGLAAPRSDVDIVVGTFGKAIGSFGAFVVCSEKIREYLVNFCSGFIYTTSLPPPVIGSIHAALDLIPTLTQEQINLQARSKQLRSELKGYGYDVGMSMSQIIPLMIGDEAKTLTLARWLEELGILATAIRPPTVPTARLRFALSCHHTSTHIQTLVDAIRTGYALSS